MVAFATRFLTLHKPATEYVVVGGSGFIAGARCRRDREGIQPLHSNSTARAAPLVRFHPASRSMSGGETGPADAAAHVLAASALHHFQQRAYDASVKVRSPAAAGLGAAQHE